MNFKQSLEILENSKVFQDFKTQHPNAELCAGFFILDFLSNDTKNSIDYMIGEKIFTFDIKENNKIFMNEDKLIEESNKPKLKKINPIIKIEVEDLKGIAGIEALEHGISAKLSKIIAVLQKYKPDKDNQEETQVWNLTCMLEGLIILNIIIDSETGKPIRFERKSMMDMIRKK